MKKLGFAVGALAGMAIAAANAREARACELNEIGIRLANQHNFNDALTCLLEANELMPNNEIIRNNITLCRRALYKSRKESREQNNYFSQNSYMHPIIDEVKPYKDDSIKYYPTLLDIPEDLLILFFKEKTTYFNSKLDLINHSKEYWSDKEIEDFIKEVEFFKDTTPDWKKKVEELKLLEIQQKEHDLQLQRKQQLEQEKLEEEQKRLDEEKEKLYRKILSSRSDFQNFIIDNMDDLCRIYSVSKVSKTYVVNYISENYSPVEVWETLEKYKE